MAIVSDARLQEAFSLALEDRSRGYADLVSNSNAILAAMKKNGGWKSFSGPTIRERLLYNETGSYVRYSGYDFLNPVPTELFNDAEYTPKLAAVSVVLSGEEILKNAGSAQLLDVMEEHISAAERELTDRFTEDLHSDGTATNQIGGLQAAVPTTVTNVYGGIDRNTVTQWRTGSYNGNTDFGAATSASNIQDQYTRVLINRTRGKQGPNMIAADSIHFRFFQAALVAIQRVTKEGQSAQLGFPSLAFAGAGYELEVVLEGGIGSAMPANTSYFLKVGDDGLRFRYHPDRNFVAFGGKQRPVNQDAIVQHIGFYGNLTLANPLFQAKLITS
ncbi:phage major capsid protein [Bradyrhizobium sp. USDA 3458]|uniref:phage major capsid protein n=1 Tax=Bradyrhizobium sp. USDA 3458 TaxID=2591461 RepID=UPI0011425B34|nr:phage major capsid protein [Bradyrhizobium sp. USDA 3458]